MPNETEDTKNHTLSKPARRAALVRAYGGFDRGNAVQFYALSVGYI